MTLYEYLIEISDHYIYIYMGIIYIYIIIDIMDIYYIYYRYL